MRPPTHPGQRTLIPRAVSPDPADEGAAQPPERSDLADRCGEVRLTRARRASPPGPTGAKREGDGSLIRRLFRSLYRIRRVEEEIARVYTTDCIQSPCHLSIGQEALSVGVCEALQASDVVFGSYRCHALYLARGGDLKRMLAELYGKSTGCAGGKGGSMHLIDVSAGIMGASAIVGASVPQSVGYAMALKMQGEYGLVASFFGDGAAEEGAFHESLNFAALRKAPVLFVCENNGYAIHSRQEDRRAGPGICALSRAHGVPAQRIETQDVMTIHAAACSAARKIRGGGGPRLLECVTYRWREHVGPGEDFAAGYRSRSDAAPYFRADAVRATGDALPPEERNRIMQAVEEEILEGFRFAEESPFPTGQELWTEVYANAGP